MIDFGRVGVGFLLLKVVSLVLFARAAALWWMIVPLSSPTISIPKS